MKKMYSLLMLAGCLFGLTQNSFAQKDSSGIYKTAEDFQQKKLMYAINYKTETHKIKSTLLFDNKTIKVKHQGKTYTLLKSETYGYRSTKGEEFRFINGMEYKVLNPGENLLLYVYQHSSHSPKETEKYMPTYFFSTSAASAPQSLTKANLKAAYPSNHKFHDGIDADLKSDNELSTYDSFHKMYKLNWLLKNSMN